MSDSMLKNDLKPHSYINGDERKFRENMEFLTLNIILFHYKIREMLTGAPRHWLRILKREIM